MRPLYLNRLYVLLTLALVVLILTYATIGAEYFPGIQVSSDAFGAVPVFVVVVFGLVTILGIGKLRAGVVLFGIAAVRSAVYMIPSIRFSYPLYVDPYYYLAAIKSVVTTGHLAPFSAQLASTGLVPVTNFQSYPLQVISMSIVSEIFRLPSETCLRFVPPLITIPLVPLIYLIAKRLSGNLTYSLYAPLLLFVADPFYITNHVHDLDMYYTFMAFFLLLYLLNPKSRSPATLLFFFALLFSYAAGPGPLQIPIFAYVLVIAMSKSNVVGRLLRRFLGSMPSLKYSDIVFGCILVVYTVYYASSSGFLATLFVKYVPSLGSRSAFTAVSVVPVSVLFTVLVVFFGAISLLERKKTSTYPRAMIWTVFLGLEIAASEFLFFGNPERLLPIFFLLAIPLATGGIATLVRYKKVLAIGAMVLLFLLGTSAVFADTSYITNTAQLPVASLSSSNQNFAFSQFDYTAVVFAGSHETAGCKIGQQIVYDWQMDGFAMYFGGLPPNQPYRQPSSPIFTESWKSNYSSLANSSLLLIPLGFQSYRSFHVNNAVLMPLLNQPHWETIFSNYQYHEYLNSGTICYVA
jgi:hypothetical protein